ncbi:MAG: hypothetical protein IJ760_01625 [Bacteroidales bacterium]|nr:hypothetical protein [Bacteroidales bacterium]
MTQRERYIEVLGRYLPEAAVPAMLDYIDMRRVHLRITASRSSKLGDYRWPRPGHPGHEITINGDLPKPLFLWVMLHEAAHLETRLKHTDVKPHGPEWQEEFRSLLAAHAALFPDDVQHDLALLLRRRPFSPTLMRRIEAALRPDSPSSPQLDSLPPGTRFRMASQPGLLFESIERRRTRWLCRELNSGRLFTVSATARVTTEQ